MQILVHADLIRYDRDMDKENTSAQHHQVKLNVAANVAALREERGWSKPELARRLSERGWQAHRQTVHKIENLDRHVTAEELWDLAQCFGVEISRLIQRGESELLELEKLDGWLFETEDELARLVTLITGRWLKAEELLITLELSVTDHSTNEGRISIIRGEIERVRQFRDGGLSYVWTRAARQALQQLEAVRADFISGGGQSAARAISDFEKRSELVRNHLRQLGDAASVDASAS